MPAFLAMPRAPGPHPVIILMHERYGLVQHTKDLAMRCARDGFLALAPNFFFKHKDPEALTKGDSRYDMTDPEAVGLLRAATAILATTKAADMSRLAVAGYCQTGRHPIAFAAEVPVRAVVVWYGAAGKREWDVSPLQPKPLGALIGELQCPVFGCFGELDHIISLEDVQRFRSALEQHKKSYDIHFLAGAPHGWLNDTMPGRYRKAQADYGWMRQQEFLKKVLAPDWKPEPVRCEFSCAFSSNYDFTKNVRME
jgi:carboxymethylenebutenolidase